MEPRLVEVLADTYSQAEVQQILNVAIAHQANAGEITRTQLIEIAEELGISLSELHQAEQEWLASQQEDQERQVFHRHRQHRFQRRTSRYTIINLFLISFDLLNDNHLSWSLYILLAWGLFVTLDAWQVFQSQGEGYETAFQNWRRQRRVREWMGSFVKRWILSP